MGAKRTLPITLSTLAPSIADRELARDSSIHPLWRRREWRRNLDELAQGRPKQAGGHVKRRTTANSSSQHDTSRTSSASEGSDPSTVSKIASFLNSPIVRRVVSAGLTFAAAALLHKNDDRKKGESGGTARPSGRALSVKSTGTRERRKPTSTSGDISAEVRTVAKPAPKGAALPAAAPTRNKRSDTGVKRLPKRTNRRAGASVEPVAVGNTNTVPSSATSGAVPKKRAAPKAPGKAAALPTAALSRKKRLDSGVKRVPKRTNKLAEAPVASSGVPAFGSTEPDAALPATSTQSSSEAAIEAHPS